MRLRRAWAFGLNVEVQTWIAKRRYLQDVEALPPAASGSGPFDCFMLLDEARVLEGMWSLYTFRMFAGPCRMVVLNDGTLSVSSIRRLQTLFPGISVPDVAANDAETLQELAGLGLRRCRAWRERFLFFRKLIDPFRLSRSDRIVLLDSDCLHFRRPSDVHAWVADARGRARFIADLHPEPFCVTPEDFERICGRPAPRFFCAGYLCLTKHTVDFARIEQYLADPLFERQLASGRFSHVAEQTLVAMEAARFGADVLPSEYATCPEVPAQPAVMGHFCGGSYQRTWFYTKGLPLVRELAFGLDAAV